MSRKIFLKFVHYLTQQSQITVLPFIKHQIKIFFTFANRNRFP
jgi:hypothetical protein